MPPTTAARRRPDGFDPLEPFASESLRREMVESLGAFRWKLYGTIPIRFHRGEPTKYEFDLNLGVIHVTEQDCQRLSELFRDMNARWGTRMTYCVYPSKQTAREMILNVRGSPRAPSEID